MRTSNLNFQSLKKISIKLVSSIFLIKTIQKKESFQKQSNELFELQKEVKILRSLNNEEIENKDDELRLLVAILYDLRIKYQELEKGKIITKGVTKSNEINVPKKINRDSTPNIRKK